MRRALKQVAGTRIGAAAGGAAVRRLLAGRSDAEIAASRVRSLAARFPVPDGFAELELSDGLRAHLHAPSAPLLYWAGRSAMEPDVVPAFLASVREARAVVDVGASFGFYAVLAARANPQARVVAVEPNPQTAAILAETIARNGLAVELLELALSDHTGTEELSLAGGLSSLDPTRWSPVVRTSRVDVRRFDDVVDGPVDVVKIDAEGAEAAVLDGMRGTLARDRPVVISEVFDESATAVLRIAGEVGYRARTLPGRAPVERAASVKHGASLLLEPRERDDAAR